MLIDLTDIPKAHQISMYQLRLLAILNEDAKESVEPIFPGCFACISVRTTVFVPCPPSHLLRTRASTPCAFSETGLATPRLSVLDFAFDSTQ